MVRWLGILLGTLRSCLRTHRELALENLALRQQLAAWKARQPRPRLTQTRPDLLGSAVEAVDELAGLATGDRRRLAPPGIQTLLSVEESTPTRSAHDQGGTTRADFADEPRQSALGRAEDPRRAAEAGPNGVAGHGVEVHAPAPAAAVAGVASVSKEPRQGSDRLGFLHGTHGDFSSALRACGAEPRPAPAGAFQCYRAPDRGMDGAATAPGVRPGGGSAVSAPRQRPSLWRTILASGQDVGHPGSRDCASLPLAKRVCRAGNWVDSTGVSRLCRGDRRTASAEDPVDVRRLLQRGTDRSEERRERK